MLKNALALVVIAALVAATTASVVGAHPGKGKANGLNRVSICHKPSGETRNEETTVEETTNEETTVEETTVEETTDGDTTVGETTDGETTDGETGRTLYLPEPAIKAHLRHGDVLGACGGSEATAQDASSGDATEPDSPKKNQNKQEERLSGHPKGKQVEGKE
jgi:hypothetical protein